VNQTLIPEKAEVTRRVQANSSFENLDTADFSDPGSDLWSRECISNESALLCLNIEMQE